MPVKVTEIKTVKQLKELTKNKHLSTISYGTRANGEIEMTIFYDDKSKLVINKTDPLKLIEDVS